MTKITTLLLFVWLNEMLNWNTSGYKVFFKLCTTQARFRRYLNIVKLLSTKFAILALVIPKILVVSAINIHCLHVSHI